MTIRYGGELPESYGLRLTVEAPDGTSGPVGDIQPLNTQIVNVGQLYKLAGTDNDGGGYKLAPCAQDDDPTTVILCQSAQRMTVVGPMTVFVLGKWSQIRRVSYKSGSAPTLGQSIKASSDLTTCVGKAFDGNTFVLYVDTVNLEVEVLC